MATPTVTAVSPNAGVSRGGFLVTITGTNFDTAVGDDGLPRVTVDFDGRPATDVGVTATTTLTCVIPRGAVPAGATSVAVTVTVTNLDPSPDPGSLASAFTYRRPDLTVETHFAAAVRALLQRLKEQVIENVALTTHTDWDLSTGDLLNRTEAAKLPAIVLVGPTLTPQRVVNYDDTETLTGTPDPTDFTQHHLPLSVDVEFDVRLMSASKVEMLNLLHEANMFIHRRGKLDEVPVDPSNPGAGTVDYGLVAVSDFDAVDRPSRANVREALGRWKIEGVLLETGDLLASGPTIDVTELVTEAIP